MNKQANEKNQTRTILTNEYNWSWFVFAFDLFSYTTLNILISLLLAMHRQSNPTIVFKPWVIYLVAGLLELVFAGFSYIDASRKNPLKRLYESKFYNMIIFTLIVIITMGIFWNNPERNAIVYGAISGGFAGYLAGGLAYPNFFIKIEDVPYRTIFGGWVGIFLGAIIGSLFAGLMDIQNYIDLTSNIQNLTDPAEILSTQLGAQTFSGIFMGFWGGAVVSGPIAAILLFVFKKNDNFTSFFTRLQLYDMNYFIVDDLKNFFKLDENKKSSQKIIKLSDVTVLQEQEPKQLHKILEILKKIAYFISPWEKDQEKDRINVFKNILSLSSKKLDLEMTDQEIKITS